MSRRSELTCCLLVCVRLVVCVSVCVCVCLLTFVSACTRDSVRSPRWPSGTPWGTKRDFPSLGVTGRMVGWWLQSFLKLSTPSLTRDLTWDWTSAWQICPDQWETSECLTTVSIERFSSSLFLQAPPPPSPSLLLFWHFFFFCLCLVKKMEM